VAAGLAVASCAVRPPAAPLLAPAPAAPKPGPAVAPAAAPLEELEPLLAWRATPGGLSIALASNGCTTRSDIVFYVERKAGGARVAFARRRLDRCRARLPAGQSIIFGWSELGLAPGAPVQLLNPVQPQP